MIFSRRRSSRAVSGSAGAGVLVFLAGAGAGVPSVSGARPNPAQCAARTRVPRRAATSGSAMAASRVAVTSSRNAAGGAGSSETRRAVRVSSSTSRARAAVSSLIRAPSADPAAARRSAASASSRDLTSGSERTRRFTTQAERVGLRNAVICLAAAGSPASRAAAASSARRSVKPSGSASYSSATASTNRSLTVSPARLQGALRYRLARLAACGGGPSSLVPRAWGGFGGKSTVRAAPRPLARSRWQNRGHDRHRAIGAGSPADRARERDGVQGRRRPDRRRLLADGAHRAAGRPHPAAAPARQLLGGVLRAGRDDYLPAG